MKPFKSFVAGLSGLLLLAQVQPAFADQTPPHTIAVMGEAEIRLPPGYATVEAGVITQGPVVGDALAENNAKMGKVIDALRLLGISDADIHTSNFSIQPKYEKPAQGDYDNDALRSIVGYLVANKVTVTVTDMTKIAKIIDASVQAGANASGEVDFRVKNLTEQMDRARVAAVENARHKALVLTTAAHLSLGPALSITDNQASTDYNGRAGGGNFETVIVTASRIPTPILAGQIAITSEVTVVYAVK